MIEGKIDPIIYLTVNFAKEMKPFLNGNVKKLLNLKKGKEFI